MQTDKELFELIKESYPLNPREEFVSATDERLKQMARKLNRKAKFIQFSFVSSGVILCAVAISWILFFSGKEVINNTLLSMGENSSSAIGNKQEPLIYIYHSHNHESFIPEIQVKESKSVLHESKNITLVGESLRRSLKEKNIYAIHEDRDVMGIMQERGLRFTKSYVVSRESLKSVLEKNKSIIMTFDIHRDARSDTNTRSDTTVNIKGKDYAKIAFILSDTSYKHEENKKFAELLHKKIEEDYPGLSKGVIVKSKGSKTEQSNYNLDLLDESVLLSIGGVENTLEEEDRTVEVFAEVIEEIIEMRK